MLYTMGQLAMHTAREGTRHQSTLASNGSCVHSARLLLSPSQYIRARAACARSVMVSTAGSGHAPEVMQLQLESHLVQGTRGKMDRLSRRIRRQDVD